jgi:hypothetical protein
MTKLKKKTNLKKKKNQNQYVLTFEVFDLHHELGTNP